MVLDAIKPILIEGALLSSCEVTSKPQAEDTTIVEAHRSAVYGLTICFHSCLTCNDFEDLQLVSVTT